MAFIMLMRLLWILAISCFLIQATPTPMDPLDHCAAREFKNSRDGAYEKMLNGIMSGLMEEPSVDVHFPVVIDVWFHIINNGSGVQNGDVTDETVKEQIQVLNQDFKSTGLFEFQLAGITRTKRPWRYIRPGSAEESQVKSLLRQGGKTTLNIYCTRLIGGLLGWSTFPQDYSQDPVSDGVVIVNTSVPGGASPSFNKGRTATHEVGHWLGLYHIFQDSCSYPNDFVDDTPPQANPSSGCPQGQKSCKASNFNPRDMEQFHRVGDSNPLVTDLVSNFMDYSADSCMTHFTAGQIQRMKLQWELRLLA